MDFILTVVCLGVFAGVALSLPKLFELTGERTWLVAIILVGTVLFLGCINQGFREVFRPDPEEYEWDGRHAMRLKS